MKRPLVSVLPLNAPARGTAMRATALLYAVPVIALSVLLGLGVRELPASEGTGGGLTETRVATRVRLWRNQAAVDAATEVTRDHR